MNTLQQFLSGYGHQLQLWLFIGLFIIAWNIENIAGILLHYKKMETCFYKCPFYSYQYSGAVAAGFGICKNN